MVFLGELSNFGNFCMEIGCCLAEIPGFGDLGAHLLVLFELGFLFPDLAFHLLDLLDQFAFLIGGEDLGLLAVLHVFDLLLEFLDAPVFQGSVLFLERFNVFKKDICLVVEIIALGLDIKDFLVVFVPEILILLRLFDKLAGLVVEGIALAGGFACGSIQFVAAVFVFFRLGKNFFSFFHQVIQHALPTPHQILLVWEA